MKILITESRGHYQKGDVVEVIDGIALQMIWENLAVKYTAPAIAPASLNADLRAMSSWESKAPVTQNRKLTKLEIKKLYSREMSYTHGKTKSIVR
jgi:hypothetical protein